MRTDRRGKAWRKRKEDRGREERGRRRKSGKRKEMEPEEGKKR